MRRSSDILSTARMLQEENLDVRTVTMGINLADCSARDIPSVAKAVQRKILGKAGSLVRICNEVSTKYGLQIVNKRLAISPASTLLEGHSASDGIVLARAMDESAKAVKVDLIGGFTALVQKGMTPGESALIESLPEVLSRTDRVCASINVGSTKAGMNVTAINLVSRQILKIAAATKARNGFGCAKLVVLRTL